MKIKLYSFYSKLISFCLLLLGFEACIGGDPVDEYGSPSAKYKVTGKVVSSDAEKTPITNMRVVMVQDVDENQNPYLTGDTVFTDANGQFEINRDNFLNSKFNIKVQDTDGDKNGLFEDKIQKIEFKDSDYKKGSSWYKGLAEKDLGTIEMTPKPKSEE